MERFRYIDCESLGLLPFVFGNVSLSMKPHINCCDLEKRLVPCEHRDQGRDLVLREKPSLYLTLRLR